MTEKEFKKLLIDLDLTIEEIRQSVGIGHWAVSRYLRGELRNSARRQQIKMVILRRASKMGVTVPDFWPAKELAGVDS